MKRKSDLLAELEEKIDEAPCEERFFQSGLSGGLELVLESSETLKQNSFSSFPCGFPPVLSAESVESFLLQPENTPLGNSSKAQKFWPREKDRSSLLEFSVSSESAKTSVDREKNPVQLTESQTSPEGLQKVTGSSALLVSDPLSVVTNQMLFSNLLSCPPGFSSGMTFQRSKTLELINSEMPAPSAENLASILTEDISNVLSDTVTATEPDSPPIPPTNDVSDSPQPEDDVTEAELNLPKDVIREDDASPSGKPGPPWACVIDSNDSVIDFHKRVPDMAMTWPFELDSFQKQAILHLEQGHNVFVAAHTSAGKTVVAEYAIALARQHMTRIIYTSPIKALSNQKFRDFRTTFEDVGLLTGDVRIKAESSCLIMTTEILRSMLYNGSEVVRDVEWVIFDECHYVNDAERGVVWEEVLIMLPPHVHIILLSATVPNTVEFAEWIGQTKKRKIFVISTMKRPVPLEHYLYTGNSHATSKEMFLVVNHSGKFLSKGYQDAINAPKNRSSSSGAKPTSKSGSSGKDFKSKSIKQDYNIWQSIITKLQKDSSLPAVAFTFSRKRCDDYGANLRSVDLTTSNEKSEIHVFFRKSVSLLKGSDQQLPQIILLHSLLKRGIGIHHSGILPIMKEVIELLFQRGLVKLLFATETFAMGVNMPARAVVFDSLQKHDGSGMRYLLPSEYIQMAGRAGRRGLDVTGTVVVLCKDKVPEASDLHSVMLGMPTKLISKFRLTYNMILNLLRFDQLRVEDMMKRSFAERELQREVQKAEVEHQELKETLRNYEERKFAKCDDIYPYYEAHRQVLKLQQKIQSFILSSPQVSKLLIPGRVVVISSSEYKNCLGVILKTTSGSRYLTSSQPSNSLVILLLPGDPENEQTVPKLTPGNFVTISQPSNPSSHRIVTVDYQAVTATLKATLKADWEALLIDHRKNQSQTGKHESKLTQELLRLAEQYTTGAEAIDPLGDVNIRDLDFVDSVRELERKRERLLSGYECVDSPYFSEAFQEAEKKFSLFEKLAHMEYLLSDDSLQLLPEYGQRVEILKGLNYLDGQSRVQLKGRVACEISSFELIITEMVFENTVSHLDPSEIVALLSCFVFQQKNCIKPSLTKNLEMGKEDILSLASRLNALQSDARLTSSTDDYMENLHFGLVEVVHEWAQGKPFRDIISLTDVQEGVIVRCIQRLSETCHDVRSAARIIGDPVLYDKMDEAARLIQRDIVFVASLYTR